MAKQVIIIELENEPEIGMAVVALNIASAISQVRSGMRFKFIQDGKSISRGIEMMIPQQPFFRPGECFTITVNKSK